jgi:hypothetical protein
MLRISMADLANRDEADAGAATRTEVREMMVRLAGIESSTFGFEVPFWSFFARFTLSRSVALSVTHLPVLTRGLPPRWAEWADTEWDGE